MYKNITHIVAGFMIIMCLVMTYYLLFTDLFIEKIYGFKRNAFIVLLLGYAAYRAFRLYTTIKKDREEK
ncbi:hypothetical protein [Fluviicola sp.]|jgi:hypothetical protein|uniref:hypothetical protein n=1 Tax=Fluviicola sp. TaxID=1917219 RepID=UPI00262CC3A5|nr:hypothetical protein [Fluviicola sp.]